jgi:serine phosphatase RsbU (regulator of sigma subunit)
MDTRATNPVDSLKTVLQETYEDTLKVNVLNELSDQLYATDPEEAIRFGRLAKNLAEKNNYKKGLAFAYKNIGLGHYMLGDFKEALENWDPSLALYQELGDDNMVANLLSNRGSVFYTTGNSVQAVEYYIRALKIAEEVNDSLRIGTLFLNIGLVYLEQSTTLNQARDYCIRAVSLGESLGNARLAGVGYLNLGQIYMGMESYDSALYYYDRALEVISSGANISTIYNDIGSIYAKQNEFPTALQYQLDALDLARNENAQYQETSALLGLASTYEQQGNLNQAIEYYQQARDLAEATGLDPELSMAYKGMADTYAALSDFRNAYRYINLHIELDNATLQKENEKKTNTLMFSYQLDKKQDEIALLEQDKEIEQLKSKRQRAMLFSIGGVGLLLLVLAGGLYNRMNFIRRTNQQIQAQKEEIESQRDEIQAARDKIQEQHDMVFSQKEMITDSISYAERIQSALLPSRSLLDEMMGDYFVILKPKDIVSGDFYWVKEVQDHLVIVGADCTGHGVPGAFMSMLGMTLLNGLINDRCFDAPSAILESLRHKIKVMLDQDGASDEQKDGMDVALAILNKKSREVHFAGANNPLYIVRNKEQGTGKDLEAFASKDNEKFQLFEIKGDKQPVGTHWEETPFTTHSINLQEKDSIYLFSDGFIDQFGGEKRKKFMSGNFKKLLLSVQEESMHKQAQILEETFESWRGDVEQIDDVSVIGVRI